MTTPSPLFPNATRPPGFVLTPDVAIVWVVRNRTPTQYPYDVVPALYRTTAIVPESWLIDLAEAMIIAERGGLIAPAQATANLTVLKGYPIVTDPDTHARAWDEILTLARNHSISVRDAAYLELAHRLNLPLATTDPTLTQAAAVAGILIFTP